jgi:alanyl aminopeptidase
VTRAEPAPTRLDHKAVPTAESVDLTCDPEKPDYSGTVHITLEVKQPTDTLRLHARALTVDSATLGGSRGTLKPSAIEPLDPDQVRLRFAAPVSPGTYTLDLAFHNRYNTRAISLYKVVTGARSYLFTQFEDTDAREAFPCWDEPAFKIPWRMTLRVPAADLAVSNTQVASETQAGASKVVVFEPTRPLPSYLVAIAVGPFETVPIAGMSVPGRVITVQGASALAVDAARAAPKLLASLERYFGRPYPYSKLDLIAAPEFLFGAMENAGAIVFADRALLIDPATASPEQRTRVFSVMAHEMAHQWFGDLVTMKWWDDLWLNESFATWMADKVMDDVYPDDRQGVSALFGIQRAFLTDSRPSTRAMRSKIEGATTLGETASELTYNKGGAVLTMFEGWVGPDKFRAGVLDYLKAHEWANAEGRDLWLAVGNQSGEDIDDAMASFLDQPGVPLVTLEPAGGGKVKLSQGRFLTVGEAPAPAPRWRVPVILRYPAGGKLRTLRVWLTRADTVADLGTAALPAWVMPNGGASGYYRWRVPDGMRTALTGAARGSLSERERMDVIFNLTAQLRAGAEHGDRHLQMIATMADDAEPEVLRADLESLDETRIALTTPRSSAALAAWVRATFDPPLRRLGMAPKPGELPGASASRALLLRLLGDAGGSAPVLAYAESLSRGYRAAPTSVPPSLVDVGIVLAARRGDRAMFEDYRRHFETATLPSDRGLYLAGMGSFRDTTLRAAALDYALEGPLRPQETLIIPAATSEEGLTLPSARQGGGVFSDAMMKWTLAHWDELVAKMPPNFAARNLRTTGGCAREREAELKAFFSDPKKDYPGIQATLRRMSDAMDECSNLHDREAERVERWLMSGATVP